MTYQSGQQLNQQIDSILELLNKQEIVQTIFHRQQHTAEKNLLEAMLHKQQAAELEEQVNKLHNADIAHLLEIIPINKRFQLWQVIAADRVTEVFLDANENIQETLLSNLPEGEILKIIQFMDADDLAFITDIIPKHLMEQRLLELSQDDQLWLNHAQSYKEDSVGSLMSNDMFIVKQFEMVKDVSKRIREIKKLPDQSDKLFVVDSRGVLTGVISLEKLLLNNPKKIIKEIMSTNVVHFSANDSASHAAKAFERYDLISAPVINERGKILGRINVEVMMDYLREENTEDVLNMVGLNAEDDLFAPVISTVRSRGLWLGINLFAVFLVSRVIGLFEQTLSEMIYLAVLMPIVAAVGGNIGNQTASLVIRGLTLGQINLQNSIHLAKKEFFVNAINGLILGVVVALFSFVFYQNTALSLVIGIAMLLNLVMAAFIGLSVPLALKYLNYDPAMGSSIITTAAADSMGFLIFLGLASVFLI